jgi:hypothetical protein
MNRTVVAAALALSMLGIASADELKVTPYEAGLDSPRSTETVSLDATKPAAAPAARYKVRALASVDDRPIWTGLFRSDFMSKDQCDDFLESPKLNDSINGLATVVREKMHPDAKVGVSCEEQPAE